MADVPWIGDKMVEKILDYLKSLPPKFMEWWNKFTSKQKTAIIAIALGVIVAFAILITVVTRTQYVVLMTCTDTAQASEVENTLKGADIQYKVSDNALVFSVNKKQLSEANLALGSSGIIADEYSSLGDVVGGSLSTTESDKRKLYVAYLEKKLARDIEQQSFVDKATVNLHIPEDDGTLISNKEESSAQVTLKLNGQCTAEQASALARAVQTAVGNDGTDRVVIMDTDGNLLFAGGEDTTLGGLASSQLTLKTDAENQVGNAVKKVLGNTNEFDLVEVATNLTLNFSDTQKVTTTYTPADGQAQGVLSHESSYESSSEGGTGLIPGTDSNVEQTYVYESGGGSSSTVSEFEKDYLPNTETVTQSIPAGGIVYDQSSVAVTAIKYNVIKEKDAKAQGLLDGITWDEYKAANDTKTKLTVDEELYSVVADASGIPTSNITIVAYEEPFFVDKEKGAFDISNILQIGLIVIILGLLAMVVLRSLQSDKKKEQPEEEEELSVEKMLQSTPAEVLDEIEEDKKPETVRVIEDFVDRNPEAVANLLRNWLAEDWG